MGVIKLVPSFGGLLASLPLLIAAQKTTTQQSAYGQCGGQSWLGPFNCVSGYACIFNNQYYSQCLPAANEYGQCGGGGYTGSTACIPGYGCVYDNEWYSECQPLASTTTASFPASTAKMGLAQAAKAAGKLYFGSATDNPELVDSPYVSHLANTLDFGQITPGNSMKWDATEPEQGNFTFAAGDVIANLAHQNGQLLRGHNCVWHSQLPSWVSSGGFDNATLLSIVQTHCSTVVSHYKGQIWDVVNEPFNDDGTLRSDVFGTTTGTAYIPTALKAARAADPAAKLYINDYNIEGLGAKSTAMFNLVQQLKAEGVPIDGIGIQGHLIVGEVPTTLIQNMQQFTSLGVEVAITELDIRMNLPATTALLQQQKQDYQTVIAACNAVPKCIGVTVWDYTDRHSWVPSTFPGQGAATPFDVNLVKKPAYDGIVAGFTNSTS